MTEIYLDNAATTRPWPEVVEAVSRAMGPGFGNASSLHRRGLGAAREVADARDAIREAVGSGEWKVVFTSGGSESDTTAILGCAPRGRRDTVVTTTVEHAAVECACASIAADRGGRVIEIPAGERGAIDPSDVAAALDDRVALVTVVHVASEIGTVQPVEEVARLVKARAPRARVHVDAVQALPQLERLDYPDEVDMVSISAHKIHGPQGVGALLVRPGVRPRPLLCGGDQQEGLRPGTLDLAGIAGFGVAARILVKRRERDVPRMRSLTDGLIGALVERIEGARPLGDQSARAPGIAVIAVPGVRGEVLLHALEMRGVLASSSSACHSSRTEPPRSLRDAGLGPDEGAVRLSLTIDTSQGDLDGAIEAFEGAAEAVRRGRAGEQ